MNGAFSNQIFFSAFLKEWFPKSLITRHNYFPRYVNPWSILENPKAQKNFEDEENKKFDLKQFRKASIRKVFDSLHGQSDDAVPLANAVEIMAYCLIDGKVDQESAFETNLYDELIEQFKGMKAGLWLTKNLA